LHLAHAESAQQITDGIVGGKSLQTKQRMQGTISPQQAGMSETPGSYQHRHQKRGEGASGIDVIRRLPADRHLLPHRLHEADLGQKGNENCDTAKRGHSALRLAQDQPLLGQQGVDLARD